MYTHRSSHLQHNLLDLIERDLIVAAIIEFCRARTLVRRHLLRVLEQPAVFEIHGNAGRAELPGLRSYGAHREPGAQAGPLEPHWFLGVVAPCSPDNHLKIEPMAPARKLAAFALTVFLLLGSSVALAQTPAPVAPTTPVERDDDFDWGWLGLLGLIGLAGLMRRDRTPEVRHRTTP